MSEGSKPKSLNDDTARRAFGEKLEEFTEALNLLYIKKNQSGRLKFADKWAAPAAYIFGPDLQEIDTRGPSFDEYSVRAALEEEAEDRRIQVKKTLADLKDKSVASGVLQFDYVAKIVEQYGVGMARVFYAENIIERVSPGLMARADEERKSREALEELERSKAEEAIRARAQGLPQDMPIRKPKAQQAAPRTAIDIPDDIRPIEPVAPASPTVPVVEAPPPVSSAAEVQPAPFEAVVGPTREVVSAPSLPSSPETVQVAGAVEVSSLPPLIPTAAVAAASTLPKPEKGMCRAAFSRAAAVPVAA